ncbi:hypothetical protein [Microvirga roseola]|uniref:hypothetical protein n=1 Tax=Microvirga roseola TaxID=2883126 RepID=UPI001E33AB83|nr:hypothetical protein [Microvirga roseola]
MTGNNIDANAVGRALRGTNSLALESIMREVLHTLGDIDFQHRAALQNLEMSGMDDRTRTEVREKLLSRHRERCKPYAGLLLTPAQTTVPPGPIRQRPA